MERVEQSNLAQALVQHFVALGIRVAFGVSGGAIARLFDAIEMSPIELYHLRHESGAAFAAVEAHFATGKPALVITTTGPGLLNATTGLTAARWEGAKVVVVSGCTNAEHRGRGAVQESSSYTLSQDWLYAPGRLFDLAVRVEHVSELAGVMRRVANGLARPGGFVAHLAIPVSLQGQRVGVSEALPDVQVSWPSARPEDLRAIASILRRESFAIWVGFGARGAASLVRQVAERTGVRVISSPRAKGIFPEDHRLYCGVSGLGGHESVYRFMARERPDRLLVLGTRLGEATSFWDPSLLPRRGLIHVDLDPDVPGTAFPEARTLFVHAEIEAFLKGLVELLPPVLGTEEKVEESLYTPAIGSSGMPRSEASGVRPSSLMAAIQRCFVDGAEVLILSEAGNAFAWCNHLLRFRTPGHYRVSTSFGAMGHATSGVVGAAISSGRKAVAVVGDGSMLMQSEISTAARYGAPAIWIVLNDAGYGMCIGGHRALGLTCSNLDFPRVDFVEFARSQGADGIAVECEDGMEDALEAALAASGPFVVDVRVDAAEASPVMKRYESLLRQGAASRPAGWEGEHRDE
jgi:acetolactate synthase I/II/III large subunit